MAYDRYGNLTRLTRPENHRHQRMFHDYTYDDTYHSLVTGVKDAYGYSSSTTYDALWSAPSSTTDLNGQRMEYTYDDMGIVKIMKEIVPEFKSRHSKYEELD